MWRFHQLGLPLPPERPLSKRPTVSQDLLDDRVVFSGGEQVEADVIVNATGYHLRFPYLPSMLVDTRHDDLNLFLGTLHPEHHDLLVVGISRPIQGAALAAKRVGPRIGRGVACGRITLRCWPGGRGKSCLGT
jgi:hypothetical protein